MNKKSLSRGDLRKILIEALEVYSEEKNPGFERNSRHREAISLLKTRKKNVTDVYFLDAIKKEGIKTSINLDNYFFWSQNRSFWSSLSSFDELKIGESGINLGISKSTDPYMYQKIGANKYRVVAGPKPEQMGFEFTKMPKSDPSPSKNIQKKDVPKEDLIKHEYTIGNTGVANAVKGTKMIKRVKGDISRKIVMTYLMPDSLKAMEIQSRVPPKPFKKVDDKKEIGEVVKEFERLTGNKIPFDIGAGKEKIVSKLSGKKLPPSEFINTFGPIIKNSVGTSGVFPSVTLAQAILETGWGRSTVGDANNMFGIKAKGKKTQYWQGDSTVSKTTEYIKGKKGSYNLGFRKYRSIEDSIKDHNLLLQKSRYKKAINAVTPEEQVKEIKAAGYATDPKYAEKLISLINKYDLKQFDSEVAALKASQKSDASRLAENKNRRKGEMIMTEEKIRLMVRNLLLNEISGQDKEHVKFVQRVIGTKDDGDWGDNTNDAWIRWVEEHVDVLEKMAEDASLTKKNILDIKADAAEIAAVILGEKSKENLAGVKELVKKYLDIVNTVKSKFNTGDKYEFVRGPINGLYRGGLQGMKNNYIKFYYNDIAIAFDIKTGEIKQRKRGEQKPFGFGQGKKLKEHVQTNVLKENFINPAKIYMDLKAGDKIANNSVYNAIVVDVGPIQFEDALDDGLENYKKNQSKEKGQLVGEVEVVGEDIVYNNLVFRSVPSPKIVAKAKQLYNSFRAAPKDQESLNKWREENIYGAYDKKYLKSTYTNRGKISGFASTEQSAWSSWFLNICALEDPVFSSQINSGKLWVGYPINSATNSDKLGLFDLQKKVMENPNEYKGKTVWIPFDISIGVPVVPGDMISTPRSGGNHMRIFVDSNGTVMGGNEGYHPKYKGPKGKRVKVEGSPEGGGMGKGSVKLNDLGTPVPGQSYARGHTYKHILKKVYIVGAKDRNFS